MIILLLRVVVAEDMPFLRQVMAAEVAQEAILLAQDKLSLQELRILLLLALVEPLELLGVLQHLAETLVSEL